MAKKKAELVEEAEALGVDPEGLKVAELEVAVTAAEQAASTTLPEGKPDVQARVDERSVRVTLGAWRESEFHEGPSILIDADEARRLAGELPDLASAALNNHNLG
jgi:hypothetical protein